jgi:hypothetical protein
MKEKDRPYFSSAKAKLNKYRKILGMEKFGLEINNDWGEIVAQNQPNIIKMGEKMDKKEIVTKLSNLFSSKVGYAAKFAELKDKFEADEGEYASAEETEKEALKEKMEATKAEMEKAEEELFGCGKDILEASAQLVKMEEEEPEDVEEYEDTEGEEDVKMACENFGATYISKTKNYVTYSKDNEVYICKFENKDGKISIADKKEKATKVFATFITGGSVTKDDTLPMPAVLVEMTKGLSRKMQKDAKDFVDKDTILAEKNAKITEYSANLEKYKKYVSEYILKFEEIVGRDNVSKEFKDEIFGDIYNMKFASQDEMKTKVYAHLYQTHKEDILGGNFPIPNKKINPTEDDKIKEIISKFKN